MLKIAVPNKGALSDDAVTLLKESGYKCSRYGRELVVSDRENGIDFIFLRPRDIAVYVAGGIVDIGITGRDLACDSGAKVCELLQLEFGRSKFCYAIPKDSNISLDHLDGLLIACSYPNIVKADLEKRHQKASTVRLDGAVEISVQLGVADLIADVVESGRTLVEAGLKVVGEPIMQSEAILIARDASAADLPDVKKLIARLRGIIVARNYALIEYDIERKNLEKGCALTPGIESPTVSPLSNPNWVAVKSMIRRKESNRIMDELCAAGAKGILITSICSCRI